MLFKMNIKKLAMLALIFVTAVSCNGDDDIVVPPTNTIADFVERTPEYSSLNTALEITDLKATVDTEPALTVFAPDNAAFSAFLSANGFANINEVPVDLLEQVLLNHVLGGVNLAADLTTGYVTNLSTATPDGSNMSMYINIDIGTGVAINGTSTVTTANIIVDNGVIHAVDEVIALPDVTTFATADPTFSTLVAALTAYDDFNFVSILQSTDNPAPFTIFAPTNQAFLDLLDELNANNLQDIPQSLLARVLSYHVVTGANVRSGALTDNMTVDTFEGGQFTVNISGSAVTITDERGRASAVIVTDVQARNGVIHAIDKVLLPEQQD